MDLLQSIHLEHLPTSHVVHFALFHSTSNAAFLHQQLLDGNAEFEYAFIDASVVRATVSLVYTSVSREESQTPYYIDTSMKSWFGRG
jgi:EKC/KEOPS complex subunit CGI121/TPRKB